jgi:hypothetical protein
MHEEADLDIFLTRSDLFTKHFWKQHQMVIMYPYQVTIVDVLGYDACKRTIGLFICLPGRFVKCDFAGMVMKKWPEDGICSTARKPETRQSAKPRGI